MDLPTVMHHATFPPVEQCRTHKTEWVDGTVDRRLAMGCLFGSSQVHASTVLHPNFLHCQLSIFNCGPRRYFVQLVTGTRCQISSFPIASLHGFSAPWSMSVSKSMVSNKKWIVRKALWFSLFCNFRRSALDETRGHSSSGP